MVLKEKHFIAVLASYHPKSSQIAALARRLNLGLDAMVFVDDNEVELEEVARALPQLHCVRFPTREEDLPGFFDQLGVLFAREGERVTEEDRQRTVLYRRRLEGMLPEDHAGADITDFLQSLRMELTLADRTQGDRTRAVQLINKTNQFNLNGRRWAAEEIGTLLAAGGRLICSSLSDRSGSHGEITACLIGPDQVIESWVMSCRVFQRRVEYAFLLALLDRGIRPVGCRFSATDRNEPIRQFLADPAFGPPSDGLVAFDAETFRRLHGADLTLFEVRG
jgi:FkbH-like protein